MSLSYGFETLLGAARAGNQRAMDVLFRDVQPLLLRYLRAHEPRVADDLASEAWLGILGKLETFEGDELAFRAWVFTIARRRLADYRRKMGRRRTDPYPLDHLDQVAPDDTASDAIAGMSASEAIDRLVAGLAPEQVDVVLLRVVADLPVEHVAAILGKSPGSVRVIQHRALRKMAERHRAAKNL
jgi:RNA polymerase sigma-70 factor, ECF subfamily